MLLWMKCILFDVYSILTKLNALNKNIMLIIFINILRCLLVAESERALKILLNE